MDALFPFLAFVFGAIIGSFLNVVIYRYNTGQGVGGRSSCMSCVRTLRWYEMVPVLSYLVLGGKCRTCYSKISHQYPLVELATGVMFALIAMTEHSPFARVYGLAVFSILMVISVYDLRHTIIPDGPVYAFIMLGFMRLFLSGYTALDLYSGIIIALFFAGVWLLSRGAWMGFGDAKLALGIGWFLPFPFNVTAIIFAFWIGALVGVTMIVVPAVGNMLLALSRAAGSKRRVTLKTEIPFAPFLALGTLITFLYPISLL